MKIAGGIIGMGDYVKIVDKCLGAFPDSLYIMKLSRIKKPLFGNATIYGEILTHAFVGEKKGFECNMHRGKEYSLTARGKLTNITVITKDEAEKEIERIKSLG